MKAVVSAIFSEVAALIELTGATPLTSDQSIYHSEPFDLLIVPVGIGYLAAALGTQRLLTTYPEIAEVMLCGTAGHYPEPGRTVALGDVVSVDRVRLLDASAELGYSRYASLASQPVYQSCPHWKTLPQRQVLTLPGITISRKLAEVLGQLYPEAVEQMELYGIAQVCVDFGVPWSAVLGITNIVGPKGHLDWQKHHQNLEQQLGERIFKLLKPSIL